MIDLKPAVNRNASNGIARAEAVRDQIYTHLVQACRDENIEMQILKSWPFSPTVWVSVECWIPYPSMPGLTDRSSATITIRSREFFRFEYEADLIVQDGKKQRKQQNIISFGPEDARKLVRYLLRRLRYRDLRFARCRVNPFAFWIPRNKPMRLKELLSRRFLAIGMATLSLGIGVIPLLIGGILYYFDSRRRSYVLSPGKPLKEPRNLIRMDSWQTLIYGLAGEIDAAKQAIRQELEHARQDGFDLAPETIRYWDVDGTQERRQLVVTFRRGIGFVHVYAYGDDLYVGWDAHLNCGLWVERQIGEGLDARSGELCRVHTIVADWHTPNEYDITDTNCLIEWTHAAVTKVLKNMIAQHHIDQEIDFKILREERKGITGRNPTPQSKPATSRSRFRREA